MARIKVLSVGVDILFLKEGKYVVAYAPALELSSYGRNEQTARKAFDEAVSIFLEETERKGTLERVLLRGIRDIGDVPGRSAGGFGDARRLTPHA